MATKAEQLASAGVLRTFTETPLAVKAIFGGVFINRVGGFLNIFLVLFLTSKGRSAAEAALALGVYGIGGVAGVLIGGVLARRLGARNATVLSMGSSAVLTASLLYLPSYPSLLVVVTAVGLISQLFRPASATLLSELTPQNRQVMIFAMYRFGLNLGATAAPLLGFGLYNLGHHRYTLLFWGEATVAALYAVLAMVALPSRAAEPSAAVGGGPVEPAAGYAAMLRDRRYLLYLVATFFNAAVYLQYLSVLPLDIKARGVALIWYTGAVALNGLLVIAFELPLTKISQRWPSKVTVVLAFGLAGIGVGCYGLPLGPAVIIIGTLIWTVAEVIGAPTVFAYPGMAGPPRLKPYYIGGFQFMFGLGSAVGPMVGGVLFSQFGHRVWPVVAAGSALAVVFAGFGVRPRGGVTVGSDEPLVEVPLTEPPVAELPA